MEGSSAFVYFRYTMFITRNYTSEPASSSAFMDTALLVAREGNACDALYHHHHHSRRNCRHRSRPYDQFVYVPGKEEASPKGVILIYSHMAVRHCRVGLAHLLRCDATPNAAHEDGDYDYSHLAPRPISRGGEDGCGNDCFIY